MTTIDNRIIALSSKGASSLMIARRIYYLSQTAAFVKDPDKEFEIYLEISNFFGIAFNSIQIVGSAKTGISLIKNTPFRASNSDIDFAVINQAIFMHYADIAFNISEGYSRNDLFPKDKTGKPTSQSFRDYLAKGIFRPDLMPFCPERAEWLSFFGRLSSKHTQFCNGMSAAIYASSTFFEWKQKVTIDKFIASRSSK